MKSWQLENTGKASLHLVNQPQPTPGLREILVRAPKFIVVHDVHRNIQLWHEYLDPHIEYLMQVVAQGILRASGPLSELANPVRQGMLIMACPSREDLIASLITDPFHTWRHRRIDRHRMG
jgi:uncharacterized protein YciI